MILGNLEQIKTNGLIFSHLEMHVKAKETIRLQSPENDSSLSVALITLKNIQTKFLHLTQKILNGKYKKITIPYDQNLSVKYGVANWNVTRDGKKQYQISSKIYITADGATYDRWRKRLKL